MHICQNSKPFGVSEANGTNEGVTRIDAEEANGLRPQKAL